MGWTELRHHLNALEKEILGIADSSALELRQEREKVGRLQDELAQAITEREAVAVQLAGERIAKMGNLIAAKKTPWAEPDNHREIAVNMDALLRRFGIVNEDQRARMTAHAIFASGWKQKVWHFNAWGVKRGSWPGDYYQMNTQEADAEGNYYAVPGASWRAFTSWKEAVEDFLNRISPTSATEGYRQASAHLVMEGPEHDSQYWDALGAGGYYTDKVFKGADFAALTRRVRSELAQATPAELEAGKAFAAANIEAHAYTGWWGLGLFAVVGGAIVWLLTRKD